MARRRGFTLVELIVVLSIITILAGLLVAAIGHLRTAAKRQQTQQVLANLQGMFGDWDAVARVPFGSSVMPCPMNVTVDANPLGMMSQADDTTASNRFGAAVWLTRDLMFNLRSIPNNAAAIGKFPADELMTMPAVLNTTFPKPYTVNTYSNGTSYSPFDTTQYGRTYIPDANNNYTYYECIHADPAYTSSLPSTSGISPPNATYWLPAYPVTPSSGALDDTVPIPLDGWGNPIIFVPGGSLGLAGVTVTGGKVMAGSGGLVAGGMTTSFTVRSPDGRPFFASAGPDGDFSQGDDNLYSFER